MAAGAHGGRAGSSLSAAIALTLGAATPAAAIPSPELIVGSVTGAAQLGAILTALVGGGAAAALRRRPGQAARTLAKVVIGLGLLAMALAGLNYYQWTSAAAARQERLSATLTRPSRLPGQPVLDATLKELGPAEQARHPLGISAAEAEALIPRAREEGYEIIDIRETAEVEMGTFRDARAMRYPDFLARGLDLGGRKPLLICHNGNRSSETCQALAERGIACRFIVGGLERWITEGRSAGGFHRSSVLDVRAVPPYPNNSRLLDTEEARALIEKEQAVLVDVRYPGEFASGHLPGAINIPMRRLTTADLELAFARLPPGPVVVPCYDRRSCFFGELAGLTLWRLGRDFRGRYTVPWEYAPRTPPPAHIAKALAERNLGLWGRSERWLARQLDRLAAEWGFLTILLGLAIASRLVILPVALKADRDQIVAQAIEPQVRRLKERLGHDQLRRARALSALYRKHGMTPGRNLLALAGLPILMLGSGALAEAARLGGHAHPLFGPLGEPDPTLLLAGAAASLIGLYAEWSLCATRRQRLLVWCLFVPGLLALLAFLPAAANLYIAASALLLMAQRALVMMSPRRIRRALEQRLSGLLCRPVPGVVDLAEARDMVEAGTKARRLGTLLAAGFPVPPGVILTAIAAEAFERGGEAERQRIRQSIRRRIGRGPYAVRSTHADEDGQAASHAGVFESATNVDPDGLDAAIRRVLASYRSAKAASYATARSAGGAVLVEQMAGARFGGVLFTRAPDAPGQMLVEIVAGGAEDLVSGRAMPLACRFGRRSGQLIGDPRPPIDLSPLLALGIRAEVSFGAAQDIEWVWGDGEFAIVQSRDITATTVSPVVVSEWDRVLSHCDATRPHEPALARNDMSALLPTPTPLSRSLLEALHASGGSADLACRALGLSYRVDEDAPELFPSVFGRLYHNVAEAGRRAPRISRLHMRRLLRDAEAADARYREQVLPEMAARLALPAATDFDALDTGALQRAVADIAQTFITVTHVETEIVNILAQAVSQAARARLEADGIDPARAIAPERRTVIEEAIAAAAQLKGDARQQMLLRALGHRSRLDYELAEPRFREDPDALSDYLAARGPIRPEKPRAPIAGKAGELARLAGRLETLKEDAKHLALIELAVLRRALLALDRRLGLGGRIFQLTLAEVVAIDAADLAPVVDLLQQREPDRNAFATVPALPSELTLIELEQLSGGSANPSKEVTGELRGQRVAGSAESRGRAFVVDHAAADGGAPLTGFAEGDVLVAPFVHPAWLGEVLRSAGVVTESGGWLSHMAIVARERDVAMIVGVGGWQRIVPGSTIVLDLDGRIRPIS